MTDNYGANDLPNPSNCSESSSDYLARAAQACEAGDLVLGMHLYLAAYEQAVADPDIPDGMALAGLHEAWSLAKELKERSMAEYVFEKLEPFLTADEIPEYANELQNLALDRLEEYGFSREDLADMAEMISNDLMGEASVVKVESISLPHFQREAGLADLDVPHEEEPEVALQEAVDEELVDEPLEKPGRPGHIGMSVADVNDFNPYDEFNTSSVGTSYHAATNDGAGEYVFTRDKDRAAESEMARLKAERGESMTESPAEEGTAAPRASEDRAVAEAAADAVKPASVDNAAEGSASQSDANDSKEGASKLARPGEAQVIGRKKGLASREASAPEAPRQGGDVFNYRQLVGYDEAIGVMRDFGVGLQRDRGFQNFVKMMNARHGLDNMPSLDTLLFRSPVIEDASRFLEATIGEIGLPVLRMSMEENMQGMPMLCVSVQGNSRPRMNHAHNRFEGPGILVIEDLDMWALPQVPDGMEGFGNFMMANISRGAREAVNLIHSAVEDPNVFVLVTATTNGEVDPFFYELLEPMSIIDIGYPNDQERDGIWREIMHDHPSMRLLDRSSLTRHSSGLSRYDIYMAAREAVEEAYKAGLTKRMYVPVSLQNMYDKLAACYPFDSDEYQALEDAMVEAFSDDLKHLEDMLNGAQD